MFRKFMMENGAIFAGVLKEIDDFIAAHKGKLDGLEKELEHLEKALAAFRGIQGMLMQYMQAGKHGLIAVYGRRILTATAQLYCGYLLMDQAVIAKKRMAELGEGHFDYNFYLGKVLSTRYYLNNVVPNVWHVAELVKIGDTSILEAPDEIFEY